MMRRKVFDKVNNVRGSTATSFNDAMAQIISNKPKERNATAKPVTPTGLSTQASLLSAEPSGMQDVNSSKWKGGFFYEDNM
jgi:hypothetical protein